MAMPIKYNCFSGYFHYCCKRFVTKLWSPGGPVHRGHALHHVFTLEVTLRKNIGHETADLRTTL